MNYPDRAAGPPAWCSYPEDDAAGAGAAAGDTISFPDMIPDYTDDLFELVWEQGGGGASGSSAMQPAAKRLWSPRFDKPPPPAAAAEEARFDPPSEDEMAAWLRAIVKGEELAIDDGRQRTASGGRDVPEVKGCCDDTSTTTETKGKLPMTEGMASGQTNQEMMKPPAGGGSSRRSHHGEAHNLTEKRRRHKINERLRTLQQLVPGCDKSNQASTLDQTIQYMKSLQQQVQAMSVGSARPPPAATAVYPVVPPQYMPMPTAPMVLGAPPAMIPFGAMLQLPHYDAAVPVMMLAAAAPLYPAAPPPVAPPGDAGSSASHRQGLLSRSSSKGKGSSTSRSLRQKHRT